jgi:hypothetical protein
MNSTIFARGRNRQHSVIKWLTYIGLLGTTAWFARSPDWEPAVTWILIAAALVRVEASSRKSPSRELPTCTRLQGPLQINDAFESLAAISSKRIQLLIQVLAPEPHLPESLADTIARRIEETSRRGVPIKYDPVLVLDSDTVSPEFRKSLRRRSEVFARRNVAQFVQPRYFHQRFAFGVDILIVDRTHLLLALNTVPAAATMQVGFMFKDQPEIATEFADWFDQILMPNTAAFFS